MKNVPTQVVVATALTGVLAAGIGVVANNRDALAEPGMEKCAGIVRRGMNDCGNNNHDCAGKSEIDGDPNEWIYVPLGTCEKIVNGRVL